jgi:imidazole glycerol-phosphate synthase subunit HisH
MMIALIDYGAGNVRSVHKALMAVGADVAVTDDPEVVNGAEKVVMPGVGAFGDCMTRLNRLGLIPVIHKIVAQDVPFLGICVGMQVLFDYGEELGGHSGLGLLPGRVVRFNLPSEYKVPHTGWNQIRPVETVPILDALPDGAWAYFNHGFSCQARPEDTLAVTDYGSDFPSVVGRGRLYGVQFHPEKSQGVGLALLRSFVEHG